MTPEPGPSRPSEATERTGPAERPDRTEPTDRTGSNGPNGRGGPAEPAEYRAERLREAIAVEPDLYELGIVVHVTGGRALLSGRATSRTQRDAITDLVERLAPDLEVLNEIEVAVATPPRDVEQDVERL